MVCLRLRRRMPSEFNSPSPARINAYLESLFSDRLPTFTVYPPLPPDANDVYKPTGKTGVALGLLSSALALRLRPSTTPRQSFGNEAPFAYHVRQRKLTEQVSAACLRGVLTACGTKWAYLANAFSTCFHPAHHWRSPAL